MLAFLVTRWLAEVVKRYYVRGKYMLGEQWTEPFGGGEKRHVCEGRERVRTSIACFVIGYIDEYGCHKGNPP